MKKYILLCLGLIGTFGVSDSEGTQLKKNFPLPSFSKIKNKVEKRKIEKTIRNGNLKQLEEVISKKNICTKWLVSSPEKSDKFYVVEIDNGEKPTYYETPLTLVINAKRLDLLNFLISVDIIQIYNQLKKIQKNDRPLINVMIEESKSNPYAEEALIILFKKSLYDPDNDPLLWSIKGGNINQLKLLLPYTKNKQQLPRYLSVACDIGNNEIIENLIEAGADPNLSYRGWPPIMCIKKVETLKLLLGHGANIDAKNNWGETRLMRAIAYREIELIKFLLENGSNPNLMNKKGQSCFEIAINKGEKEIVDLIEPKTSILNRLAFYIKTRDLEKATTIAKEIDGESVNRRCGEDSLLTLLLEHFEEQSFELVQILIEHGADVNLAGKKGMTPLMLAVASENVGLVKLILNNGAKGSINAQNIDKDTALTIAVQVDNVDIIEILLENGSDTTIQDVDGKTPIMLLIANEHPNLEILRLLLEHGANRSAKLKDERGKTALMMACEKSNMGIVEVLLALPEIGGFINLQDEEGRTAVMYAVEGGIRSSSDTNVEILQELIEAMADINKCNEEGNTALDMVCNADYVGNGRIEQVLINNGAFRWYQIEKKVKKKKKKWTKKKK